MSWPAFISRLLEDTNKIEKVAIFNSNGAPLAVTEDLAITKAEGQALFRSLDDPSRSIAKIHIDGMDYTCFQGNDNTLIGNNKSKKRTFIAHLKDGNMIMVLGDSEGHGSFLFELKRNLLFWQKNQKNVTTRREGERNNPKPNRGSQPIQPPQYTDVNANEPSQIAQDLISQSDVLIDMQQTTETPTLPSDLQQEIDLLDTNEQQNNVLY